MLASIIIITKNQKHHLKKSLPILLKQNTKQNYEIIVVDSGSTDGARAYVQSLKTVKLIKINPDTFNFARAFNTGAKKAKGTYLIRLSGDAIPTKTNFVKEITKPFNNPKVGGTYGIYTISGRKNYVYPSYWPKERFPNKLTTYSINPTPLSLINPKTNNLVFNFAGGCCAIRKDIWEKRPFNEKLYAAEDAEYAWFLHVTGYDIVCNPEAITLHEHTEERKKFLSPKKIFQLLQWTSRLYWEILTYWIKWSTQT